MKMAKKKPKEESEGIAESALRELGLGNLVDFALKLPGFQQRFSEVNEEIGERLSKGTPGPVRPRKHLGIRPHVESSYSVRYIREETGEEWRPTVRKPIQKPVRKPVQRIVAEPEGIEPLVDIFDEKDHLRVVAELPGVEEHDIKTEIKGSALRISAESKDRKYDKRVELPAAVMGELATSFKHGVLEIKLKKK